MEQPDFDATSRAFAQATSRRAALKLAPFLGRGSLLAGFLALVNPVAAEAADCTKDGKKCKDKKECCSGVCCNGVCCSSGQVCQHGMCITTPPPPPGPNLLRCVCRDGTQLDFCTTVDCNSGPAQDVVCGPACASHGGEQATGCLFDSPPCV